MSLIGWSMAKMAVNALVGIAVQNGTEFDVNALYANGQVEDHNVQLTSGTTLSAAAGVTFKAVAEAHIAANEDGWRNPKHRQQWRNTLASYCYPVIGDLPLVGRAFQSKVTQIERKNIMIFVTARLLDPSGNFVNQQGARTAAAP